VADERGAEGDACDGSEQEHRRCSTTNPAPPPLLLPAFPEALVGVDPAVDVSGHGP